MADFERDLSALFEAAQDEPLAERLTAAAVGQIEREDRRRQWVLTAGVAAGVTVFVSTVVGSGVLSQAGTVGLHALQAVPRLLDQPLAWVAAASALAAYAIAALRPGRAL